MEVTIQEIIFATHDGIDLKGDLYLPSDTENHPVVVGVPGGGWRIGHRSALADWGKHLASHGVGFFAVDYRRSTLGKCFPEAVRDVRSAIQFLRGKGSELRVNGDRIGILGASAGAQIASLVALAADHRPFNTGYESDPFVDVSASVQVLIGVYGIYDIFSQWQQVIKNNLSGENNIVERYLGTSPFSDPQVYFDASPIRQVTTAANKLPVLLVWGTQDDFVDQSQSTTFSTVLRQAGFSVKTHCVLGAGHYWFSEDPIADPNGHTRLCAAPILRTLQSALLR
ncbi:alpha/beta hydrolase [Caballeronia sp. DA-9]|uniref:alpha/beta hydrolase n=1 Tax=Caballeronia sp. DA-9 TaxID=3436237 RepID=UPI003F671140